MPTIRAALLALIRRATCRDRFELMKRELKSVRTEDVLGAVDDSLDQPFVGAAERVLGGLRREVGDAKTLDIVLLEGWSNGHLYFGDLIDSEAR